MTTSKNILREIVVRNPKTGQKMIATIKTFETLYQHKGFEIVDRDNAAIAAPMPAAKEKIRKGETVSTVGSAADIAASLNLVPADDGPDRADNAPGGVAAGDNAEKDVKEAKDANDSNSDSDDESGFRAPAKRDRGRRSK